MHILKIFLLASFTALFACTEVQNTNTNGRGDAFPWGGGGQQTGFDNGTPYSGFSVSGNDQYFDAAALGSNAPVQAIVIPEGGDTVQLNLVNASIAAAANVVIRDTLNRNFIIADDVTGKITLQTTGRISKSALLELFEDALALNNARLVDNNGQLRIVRADGLSRAFRSAGTGSDAAIIVAPLRYVSPQSMLSVLQPAIEEGLWVKALNAHNLILFAGSSSSINTAMEALNIFDVDVLAGKSIALIPVQAAETVALVAELKSIFESSEGGRLEGSIEFIPNPGSRSILVIATRSALIDDAKSWVRQLDTAARESGAYVEIYPLNFRDAAELAPILNSLMSSGSLAVTESEVAPDNSSGVRISADIARNGIIVRAQNRDHEEIRKLLARLDTSARQVLLEATIVEVALNENLNLGVRWFFQNGGFSIGMTDQTNGSATADYPGFSAVFSGLNAQVALNALSSVTNVQVLSSPTLMVVENQSAVLRIGDQVPVATQNSASSDDAVVTTIEYRDTGVVLNVTPRIGANGNVTLLISQEVSDVVATTTSGIDSPTIRQRKIETTVTIANGATLTLGGLIQERGNNGRSGVPGLQNAPLFGGLFRNQNNRYSRTELLILIRPLVINNATEAARVTNFWRNQLSGADGIYENGVSQPHHLIFSGG